MNRPRPGCLSPLALLSAFITLVILLAAEILSGNSMFSPGALNAQPGDPLGGVTAHAEIGKNCAACHTAPWSAERMSDRCTVCHTAIQAELGNAATLHGAFHAQDGARACQKCHPEHRGASAPLTVINNGDFPHEAVGFSLAGHVKRPDHKPFLCADCHTESITTFQLQTCTDCHQQIDFAFTTAHALDFGNDCLACHDGIDRYGQFDHNQVSFALTGAHSKAACSDCHRGARTTADLQKTTATCEACHILDDAHNGKFGSACGTCHTPDGWKPASFDHNLAAFKLEGKHAEVPCEKCHISGYQGTPTNCYACHKQDDAHNGKYGQQCETCHNPTDWEDATFDHNLSAFPLEGAHTRVACESCHKNNVFKGTSTQCAACHNEPLYHAGMFPGQACSACHTTAAWRPARYTGPHTFPMNHGEKNNTCSDCHQPNLTTWTCYTCHNQGEVARKHQEEGISNFGDCLRCHPTGQEGEGGD